MASILNNPSAITALQSLRSTQNALSVAQKQVSTGYKIGGISPFGQMKRVPVVIDETAILWAAIFINGGQRGLQVRLTAQDAAEVLDARLADISA